MFNEQDLHWMIKRAYAQGVLDGLENAANVVEQYDVGAKHIVSKMQADERKKHLAHLIRNLKVAEDHSGDEWNMALEQAALLADDTVDEYNANDPYCQGICDASFGIAHAIRNLKR